MFARKWNTAQFIIHYDCWFKRYKCVSPKFMGLPLCQTMYGRYFFNASQPVKCESVFTRLCILMYIHASPCAYLYNSPVTYCWHVIHGNRCLQHRLPLRSSPEPFINLLLHLGLNQRSARQGRGEVHTRRQRPLSGIRRMRKVSADLRTAIQFQSVLLICGFQFLFPKSLYSVTL